MVSIYHWVERGRIAGQDDGQEWIDQRAREKWQRPGPWFAALKCPHVSAPWKILGLRLGDELPDNLGFRGFEEAAVTTATPSCVRLL